MYDQVVLHLKESRLKDERSWTYESRNLQNMVTSGPIPPGLQKMHGDLLSYTLFLRSLCTYLFPRELLLAAARVGQQRRRMYRYTEWTQINASLQCDDGQWPETCLPMFLAHWRGFCIKSLQCSAVFVRVHSVFVAQDVDLSRMAVLWLDHMREDCHAYIPWLNVNSRKLGMNGESNLTIGSLRLQSATT